MRRTLRHGDLTLEIGHVGWQGHPFLGSMQHRGVTLQAPVARGVAVSAVDEETRQAWNGGFELDLLRGKPMGAERTVDLTLALRHEEIEPQFRSVAAFLAADRRHDTAELRGQIGIVSMQLVHSRSRDNLDRIASILTTRTRRSAANFSVPLSEAFGGGAAWPALSYSAERTHQYGLALPENGGFSASHIPDQISLSHALGLDWTGASWRLGYRLALSDQDNRQPGRELADFEGVIHCLFRCSILAGHLGPVWR